MDSMLGLFNKRNVFDLSHDRKFSCSMGTLIPILCEEVVPGDTFKVQTELLLRFMPLVAPMMHRVNVFTHYFFVPNRLIWANWPKFITGGEDGKDATVWPYIDSEPYESGSPADYFGLPVNTIAAPSVSALPMRAYGLIWNEWFRDQNHQEALVISLADGLDTVSTVGFAAKDDLLRRNWEKDYFTSALPWPQRGDAVTLGLAGSAPATITGTAAEPSVDIPVGNIDSAVFQAHVIRNEAPLSGGIDGPQGGAYTAGDFVLARKPAVNIPVTGSGTVDLSDVSVVSINALRQAFQVQKWMERNARAGVRYVESILSHFGVRSSDQRLQRPEFLGGGRSSVVISEVLQTSESATTPQGTLAGHGYSAHQSHEFTKSFEEHGLIIGLLSVMPRTGYQQGVSRMWSRLSRYDYYWPEFAHLGEQAVLQKEVFATGDPVEDNVVFGYQGRYDEYRRRESSVHGNFRDSLDFWHMGRIFADSPTLDSDFVSCVPDTRPFAVRGSDEVCLIQLINQVEAIRPIPKTGEPGLIDHN